MRPKVIAVFPIGNSLKINIYLYLYIYSITTLPQLSPAGLYRNTKQIWSIENITATIALNFNVE
jgi:hypothetical protein